MRVTGQHLRVMTARGGKDNGVSRRQFVLGMQFGGQQGQSRIQRYNPTEFSVSDHLMSRVLATFPIQPFRQFQLHQCRHQALLTSRELRFQHFAGGAVQ